MKTTKYKLSDMAKDLKVTNNDLIECLGKLGGEPKKTQSVLTPEETCPRTFQTSNESSGVLYTEQSGGQL